MPYSTYHFESDFTREQALQYLHTHFNHDHHSDARAEKHTYVNRQCFLNALGAENDHLNEQKIEINAIPSSDRTDLQSSALDRIDKRIKQLNRDIAVLEEDREEHLPHYAYVALATAYINGIALVPESDGSSRRPYTSGADRIATRLARKLLEDETLTNKYEALDNMIINLESDGERAHDSLDRLIPSNYRLANQQWENPQSLQALYDVLIQDPPQTGSSAIRGETPAEAPDEGATE